MQGLRLALVFGLVLSAGCVGFFGDGPVSDGTPRQTASQTQTGPSLEIADIGGHNLSEKRNGTVTVTVANEGAVGSGAVVLRHDGTVLDRRTVALDAGASRTITFPSVATGRMDPGTYTYTVATSDDDATVTLAVEPRSKRPEVDRSRSDQYDGYIRNVTRRVNRSVLRSGAAVDARTVRFVFGPDRDRLDRYRSGRSTPVPQAAALELAATPNGPRRVRLEISNGSSTVWRSNFTRSMAEDFADESTLPGEFRASLSRRATGPLAGIAPRRLPAVVTWATGDRARRAYLRELVTRLHNSTHSEHINVADVGLYNESAYFGETDTTVEENTSVYVNFTYPQTLGQVQYGDRKATPRAIAEIETAQIWANLSWSVPHGDPPERVRYWISTPDGTVYERSDIPSLWAEAHKSGRLSWIDYYLGIARTGELYNGGPKRKTDS